MNDIVFAIVTRLKADADVAAVVGARVHRSQLPKYPTFPAITVTRIDKIRDTDTSMGRYAHARIQCTTWATSDGAAENLAELVADSLHRTINTILTAGSGTVYVVSMKDAGGIPDMDMEIPLYMEHRDFLIMYSYK